MPVGRATGYPDYGFGVDKPAYIPILFAGKLLEKFYDASTVAAISTTDYVGEIQNQGDTVYIRTRPSVTIKNYVKGGTLELEYPESPAIEFTVDRAKYYNFALDDIDIKEMGKSIDYLEEFAADASEQLKIVYDTEVLGTVYTQVAAQNKGANAGRISGNINLGATGAPLAVSKTNILDVIVDCGVVLDEQNAPQENRYIVFPPAIAGMLKKSDLRNASITGDSVSPLRNGYIGNIDRFEIYISNLLSKVTSGDDAGTYNIIFGQKKALVFVMQLTKNETYRPQNTFAEAMKGLAVYGFKVIQPTLMGHLYAKPST